MAKFTRSKTDRANKSDALKAYWARVRADTEAYAARTANMGTKSPEKVSAARKRYFENQANRDNLSAYRASWWASKTPEERSRLTAHLPKDGDRKLRAYRAKPNLHERHSAVMTEVNARPDVRAVHSDNTRRLRRDRPELYEHAAPRTWYHELASGRQILVQSSWEAACADALESFGLAFDRGGRVDLVDCSWRPDFLVTVDDVDFYLEVKGHPLAVAQFERVQLPCLRHSPLPVALLAQPPPYSTNLDRFIAQLDWLH